MKQRAKKKPASTLGKKPRAKKAAVPADTRWQTCSICKTIPDRSWAFWKGGDQRENNLPPSMDLFKIVGEPFYNTDTGCSNYCLMQCPECKTYYAWDFEYEYLFNGSEDEINLTRLSQAEGEKRAQVVLKAVETHNAWFMEQAPQHIEALRHAPREPDRLSAAANFFFSEGAHKGCDLVFALPDLLRAYSRMGRIRDAAGTIHIALFAYGSQNWKNLQTLREQLRAASMDADPAFVSLLSSCEKTLRADCRICRNLPDYVSVLMISEDLPAASRQLVELAPHFEQCPTCGTVYFMDCDDFPFVSGASDEMSLSRLQPSQSDLLQPFLEPVARDELNQLAVYLGRVGCLAQAEANDHGVAAVVKALLCALSNLNETVRALSVKSLERFIAARADNARLVLDVLSRYDEATWHVTLLKNTPELQYLVRQCQAVLDQSRRSPTE